LRFNQIATGSSARAAQYGRGNWAREDGLVRAHIAGCGKAVCATNFWVKDPQGDEKVGDKLIMTLTEASPNHWTGEAFDPKRNRIYSMEMSLEDKHLTTQGCVMGGLFCRSVGWSRIGR
jgi:uncharacterized protein (DUF2147 family)